MIFNFNSMDIKDLEEKYPDAYNFLVHRSLINEGNHLHNLKLSGTITEWQNKRLQDLAHLFN